MISQIDDIMIYWPIALQPSFPPWSFEFFLLLESLETRFNSQPRTQDLLGHPSSSHSQRRKSRSRQTSMRWKRHTSIECRIRSSYQRSDVPEYFGIFVPSGKIAHKMVLTPIKLSVVSNCPRTHFEADLKDEILTGGQCRPWSNSFLSHAHKSLAKCPDPLSITRNRQVSRQ